LRRCRGSARRQPDHQPQAGRPAGVPAGGPPGRARGEAGRGEGGPLTGEGMGPVRVKVYGLFPRTRRRYVTEALVGGLLLLAALVAWWLGWPELEARLKRLPQVRGVVVTETVLANVPGTVLAAAVLKCLELIVVLRRFTYKEALQRARDPQPQPPTRET